LDVFHEESAMMSENIDIWYGYLEAGEKSSPVLIDSKLDTGNSKTFYMYNHNSQRIIEYKREIAEPKLRTLKEPEKTLLKELVEGYETARKEFTPRTKGVAAIPVGEALKVDKSPPKQARVATVIDPIEPMEDFDDDIDDEGDDIELDETMDDESDTDIED
jgi:hypothetical protein